MDSSENINKESLDRLLLCNRIREITGVRTPVTIKDLVYMRVLLTGLVWLVYGPNWRRLLFYPVVFVLLQLMLGVKKISAFDFSKTWKYCMSKVVRFKRHIDAKRDVVTPNWNCDNIGRISILNRIVRKVRKIIISSGRNFVITTYLNLRSYARSPSEITGYVVSTEKETPLMRICLLLRIKRFYGVCIELLIKRLNSGLPNKEVRYCLAFFLREIGEEEAACKIYPLYSSEEEHYTQRNSSSELFFNENPISKLQYGLIVPTMFDSKIFHSSLLSLVNSDFKGEIIVVEEGNNVNKVCEEFCRGLSVKYIKNTVFAGPSSCLNLGIEHLSKDVDIIIYSHNDVLWPRRWFGQLNTSWEKVYKTGKVGLINLGYLQFLNNADNILNDLFAEGRYDDLFWILKAAKDIPYLAKIVQDVENKDMGKNFGLACDPWNEDIDRLKIMNGRFSVAASFLKEIWTDLGGFTPDIFMGDLEIQYNCLKNKKHCLWTSNPPLIHCRSVDTELLLGTDSVKFQQMYHEGYRSFPKKYGYEVAHFLFTYFAETSVIYQDEIINAVNELRFSDIDFIFEDFFERLKKKKLKSCELVWCESRKSCKYN